MANSPAQIGQVLHRQFGQILATPVLNSEDDPLDLVDAIIDDHAHSRWTDVSARFDDTMRAGLTEEGLAAAWSYLVGLAGTY